MSRLDAIQAALGRIGYGAEAQDVIRTYGGYPQFWARELRSRGMDGAAAYVEQVQREAATATPPAPRIPAGYPVRDGAAPLRTLAEWEALDATARGERMDEADFLLEHGEWDEPQAPAQEEAAQATAPTVPATPEIPAADLVPAPIAAAAQRHAATTVQPPPGKAPLESIAQWEALPQAERIARLDEVDVLLAGGA